MKKRFSFAVLLAILMGLMSSTYVNAQSYTVSPTGYTSVPSSNVTHGSRTLHGNLLQVKATVSGSTATFTLKKNDGSKFQNGGSIFVRKDTYSGSNVQSSVQYSAGIYNPTVDVSLDFTSGSKTYVIVISSKGSNETYYYYSNPITITASSTLATPDYNQFSYSNVTSSGFRAKWASVSGATKYNILVKKASDTNYNNPVFEEYNLTTTYCDVTGLQPNTAYQFQVQAVNSTGKSSWSKSIQTSITTLGEYTLDTPDYTQFTYSNVTSTGFRAKWSSVSGATKYNILVKKASDTNYNNPVYEANNLTTTYCDVTGLQSNTAYQFQVQAVNNTGKSSWSKSIQSSVTTNSASSGSSDYTVSPSGYTSVPTTDVTHGSRTLHGNVLQAKAIVSGSIATFTLKKSDGSKFQNGGSIFVRQDSYSGSNVQSSVQYSADIYYPTVDVNLDFTSGSKTYVIVISSKGSNDTYYYYTNPITIKASTSSSLDTPDKTTFKATNITETGFTASWGSVQGADCYDIYVKRASDADYSNPVFKRATSRTYINVTDLNPGTSYQFQIRARNSQSKQSSNWSPSIPTAVTTKKTGTEPANISIYAVRGFDGTKSLVVGKTYTYSVYVVNNGSSDWKGSFYLKEGNTDLQPWHNISLVGGAKAVQRLEYNYTPEQVGSKTLTLYYQTNTTGGGLPVNAGSAKNPMTIIVIADPSAYDGLKLKSAIVYPTTLELGKKGTISAEIQNTGNTDWYGTLYLTDNNVFIGSVENLPKGERKSIIKTAWEPQTTGTHSIAVYYKTSNSNNMQLVTANGFSNPVNCSVYREQNTVVDNNVKLKYLTKDVAPQYVTEGTEVYCHYKVTDMNDNPIKGIKATFSSSNNSIIVDSDESDDDGIFTLCLKTDGNERVASPGNSVTLQCVDLINNDGQHYKIYAANSNDHSVSLTVLRKTKFENAENVNLSIDLGLSAKAEFTNYLKGNAGVSVPLKFGWSFDEANNFSHYTFGLGIKGEFGCKAELGNTLLKLKGVEVGGKAAVGYESSYEHETFKPIIWALVYNVCNALPPTTNRVLKFGADVYKAWYEESNIEKPVVTQNGFVNVSAGGGFNYTFDYPTSPGLKNKIARLPQNIGLTDFSLKGDFAFKWEFNKTKKDMATGVKTYCNSTSLKVNVESDIERNIKNDMFLSKSFWLNSSIYDFYQSKILYFLKYKSFVADKKLTLSFKENEEYLDEAKKQLQKASHEISWTSGYELSVDELVLNSGWVPLDGSIRYSTTCSSKVTLGKGYLNYLHTKVLNNDKDKDIICMAIPAFSANSLISEPNLIYNAWKHDYLGSLTQICIPNSATYSLKESMKVEQANSSKIGLEVKIPIYDFKIAKLSLDVGAELELENRPSVSYYSVESNRFFPIVLRPSTSIPGLVQYLTNSLTNEYIEESYKEHEEALNAKWTFMNNAQYGTGYVNNDIPLTFTTMNTGHTSIINSRTGNVYDFVRSRRPSLAEMTQDDICTFTFVLNDGIKNFNKDTDMEFSHFYPAGDLLGVTDQGDTIFVVSEVCDLAAMQGIDTLQVTQSGQFKLDTTIGIDDLTPFGFPEDTSLDVYYSEKGSTIWHYVGPAGTTIMTDKFGAYMIGTSIKNDDISPEIRAELDEQTGIISINVNENVGLRQKTLTILLNGIAKEYNVINESCFEVYLSEEERQYRLVLDVSIYDLAGNMGSLSQVYQLDKPEKININILPDTDISQLENTIYIGNVSAEKGKDMTLSVKMKNSVVAEGFQFDLELPEGVTVAKDADGFAEAYLSTERTSSRKTNTFDADFEANGALRVMAGSTNGSTISGNDGEVATIKLNVANSVAEGSYPIVLRNISISDSNAKSYDVDLVKSTLTVTGVLGDVDGDGYVTKADVTALADYIMGRNPESFNYNNANINGDFNVDVADLVLLLNMVQ